MISKHYCTTVKLHRYSPSNNQSVTMTFGTKSKRFDEELELSIYGLPENKARRLAEVLKEIGEMEVDE
jgi:hypothetical protein